MKLRKGMIISLILIVVAVVSVFGIKRFQQRQEHQSVANATAPRTMTVPRGTIIRTIGASGNISGARQVSLGFPVSGQVKRVLVKKGDFVETGSVLAEMESSQQELAVVRAKNALEIAKLDGTEYTRRERELDLRIAEENLARTKIIASFSGIVTEVGIEEGESVSANNAAITLLDNSQFYANVTVDELDMRLISVGQSAIVTVDALGGTPLKGVVADIGLIAQASGGLITVPVSIRIVEDPEELRVGYSAYVQIETARVDDVLKLPLEAVVRRGDQSIVTVLRNGVETPVVVKTGLTDGREVEILTGLNPDDQVVSFNFRFYSQPGTTVTPAVPMTGGNIQQQIQRLGGFGR